MNSSAGISVNGFLGGNIKGWFEIGLIGGWGQLSPKPQANTHVLSLYGIEDLSALVEDQPVVIDLSRLVVDRAKSTNFHVGPSLRIHFIPRGPVAAFLGSGLGYDLYRSHFSASSGPAKIDFHGIVVPIEAGINIHVIKRLALSAKFNYLWTYFALLVAEQPQQFEHRLIAPVALIDAALGTINANLAQDLPHFWTATAGIRLTL